MDENLGVPPHSAMPRPDLTGITVFTSQANRAYEGAGRSPRRTAGHWGVAMLRRERSEYKLGSGGERGENNGPTSALGEVGP